MKFKKIVVTVLLSWSGAAMADLEVVQTGIAVADAPKRAPYEAGHVSRLLKDGRPLESKLIEVNGDTQSWEDSDGCKWTRSYPSLYAAPSMSWTDCDGSSGTAAVQHVSGESWPMKVGNKWSFSVRGDSWSTNRDCEVADTARARIALGEYDTFKVVCTDRWNTRTYYYAPSIGSYVFLETFRRARAQRTHYERAAE
jgi:hypothetical protein